jgi:hypothetical protein
MTTDVDQAVEVVGTYARREGTTVRLQLHLPTAAELTEPRLQLRRRGEASPVECAATVSSVGTWSTLNASVDGDRLRSGTWRLWVKPDGASDFRRMAAWLVVRDSQPIALLSGETPRTQMAPPRPRRRPAGTAGGRRRSQARRALVKVADSALSRLPEERRARYRSTLAKAARRVRI